MIDGSVLPTSFDFKGRVAMKRVVINGQLSVTARVLVPIMTVHKSIHFIEISLQQPPLYS